MEEVWKDIYFKDKGVLYDYRELYWVSKFGRIKAKAAVTNQYHKKGEIYEIKYRYNIRTYNKNGGLGGYCIVALYNRGKRRDVQLHRIVANMFIPNPNWMYKLRKELTKGYMYFCSYSCYRKAGGDNGKQTYVRGKQPK